MKAGKYWIGDLCYVLSDAAWDEVVKLVFPNGSTTPLEGEFTLSDGRKLAILSTKYGDGTYRDGHGNQYDVDSGSIGCIIASEIGENNTESTGLGNRITFPHAFEVKNVDGVLHFGRVKIDTADEGSWDDEY